ncbi:MAG: hypothetical protein FJ260_10150 [Planctomycetes bacterium]|nr:hypothetical protein [Planctomycetota bacterium]
MRTASLANLMNPDDPFPSTHTTWMHDELGAGEERRRALRTVVMARYFEPLRVYVKGSSYRHLGESAELVSAFFVSRFARDDYLDAWKQSGMTLRRWLINGLILSMREEIRRRRRAARRGMQDVREGPPGSAAQAGARSPSVADGEADEPNDPLAALESPEPEAQAAFERACTARAESVNAQIPRTRTTIAASADGSWPRRCPRGSGGAGATRRTPRARDPAEAKTQAGSPA